MSIKSAMIDAMARSIWIASNENTSGFSLGAWDDPGAQGWKAHWHALARAAYAAMQQIMMEHDI